MCVCADLLEEGLGWFHNFFNVKMLWLTCLFDLIGGGWVVDQSLLFTYFSDGLEANKMYGRAFLHLDR